MSKPEVEQLGRPSDDEALKLTVTFYCIMEPERRAELLAIAEKMAAQSQHVEGVTHFLDLDPASLKAKSPH